MLHSTFPNETWYTKVFCARKLQAVHSTFLKKKRAIPADGAFIRRLLGRDDIFPTLFVLSWQYVRSKWSYANVILERGFWLCSRGKMTSLFYSMPHHPLLVWFFEQWCIWKIFACSLAQCLYACAAEHVSCGLFISIKKGPYRIKTWGACYADG